MGEVEACNGAGNPDLHCSRRGCHGKGDLDWEGLIAWECAARGLGEAVDVVVREKQIQEFLTALELKLM